MNGVRRIVRCEVEVKCEEVPEGSSASGYARVGERFGHSLNGATPPAVPISSRSTLTGPMTIVLGRPSDGAASKSSDSSDREGIIG